MDNRATSAKVARFDGMSALSETLGDWAVGPRPLFRQLARAIASAVERGTLARGTRLPSERTLARALIISRGTAVAAYDLLVADGLVERRASSGTYVLGAGALGLPAGREGSALVHRLVDRSAADSSVIDLSISVLHDAGGLPDALVSTADLLTVRPETGYSPWGLPGLRSAIAGHVTGWGLPTTANEVVITTGAQQAISAAAACWVRPGDAVVVDDPTYPGAVSAFVQAGAHLVGLPVDRHGIRPADLRTALASRPALVYLQSTLHSPTGVVLAEGRREELAAIVTASRVPLVEDLALADLAWERRPPPIAAFCPDASVVVVGSLSKLFWGGLRVGWARANEAIALRFARVKATHDLGSSAVGQLLAERLLRSDDLESFAVRRRLLMRHRYGILAGALRAQLPDWTWPEPSGGLSVWVRLPAMAGETFAQIAVRHGVAVATSRALSASGNHDDCIRISFSGPPDVLLEGVDRLAAAWRAASPGR
jgi:DNA-binding transcriptional MocR family regulator